MLYATIRVAGAGASRLLFRLFTSARMFNDRYVVSEPSISSSTSTVYARDFACFPLHDGTHGL